MGRLLWRLEEEERSSGLKLGDVEFIDELFDSCSSLVSSVRF
jgi:hypothetical protein